MTIRVVSFGGGVQSTALLVLAAQAKIDYRVFLFANVGEDSENPETLDYVNAYAKPFAERHGLELHELIKTRFGERETVYSRITQPKSRSIGIPVRMSNGAPGRRQCTMDFKIRLVDRWLKQRGAKAEGATVGLGISLDEIDRMKPNMDKETMGWKQNAHPLIDLRLDRLACQRIIHEAGLPVPPKSSCYFCPFHSPRRWQEMRETQPVQFFKAVELERLINRRREVRGFDAVYFTRFAKPLDKVTTGEFTQAYLFEDEVCESGYCMI
jgi:hypothetical protein